MAFLAKHAVVAERPAGKTDAKWRLVKEGSQKPDHDYVLVARAGANVHPDHLRNYSDGDIKEHFKSSDGAPDPDQPKPVPAAPPTVAPKASGSKSSVKIAKKTKRR